MNYQVGDVVAFKNSFWKILSIKGDAIYLRKQTIQNNSVVENSHRNVIAHISDILTRNRSKENFRVFCGEPQIQIGRIIYQYQWLNANNGELSAKKGWISADTFIGKDVDSSPSSICTGNFFVKKGSIGNHAAVHIQSRHLIHLIELEVEGYGSVNVVVTSPKELSLVVKEFSSITGILEHGRFYGTTRFEQMYI